jgi:hypothetical protein
MIYSLIIIIITMIVFLMINYAFSTLAELIKSVLSDILGMEALQYNNYIKHME